MIKRDKHATPRKGSVQGQCAITAKERKAVEFFTGFHTEGYGMIEAHAATLRKLLERLK